jgi:subfamily B ATP-binding cassette protein MsbA
MHPLRRLLVYVRPLHHYLPEYLIYTLFGILFGIVNFTMLIPLLNLLFNTPETSTLSQAPEPSFSIQYLSNLFNYKVGTVMREQGKMHALGLVCIVIGIASLLANGFRYMSTRVMTRLKINVLQRLRNHLYAKITEQSLAWYQRNRKGDVLSTMTNDVQEIELSIITSFQILLRDPFVIIGYFITLFYLSPQLTLFTLLFFPVSGVLISTLARRLKKKGYYSQDMLGRIMQHTDETLSGVRIIQAFGVAHRFRDRFASINARFSANSRALFNQRELASPVSEVLGVLVVVAVVLFGGNLVIEGQLSGSMLITYLALYSQILQPAKNISSAISNMQKGLVSCERVYAILDAEPEVKQNPSAAPVQGFHDRVQFRNIQFAYEVGHPVIHGLSFDLIKGQTVALVGRSGSGKSTLANLLLRFYDVQQGQILWDGKALNELQLDEVRRHIGLVNQDPVLFNDSVAQNICMGEAQPDMQRLEEAARNAHALEFIDALPEGFNTVLGDRGSRLSGGQRQRIAIARALYFNPPILILDEATSALDTESEKLVQDALQRLMQNRTSLVIAHRLSTVRHANLILVLDQGRIIEQGSHESLMQQGGMYRRLQEMQELH